jgi:hypothetical protein
MVKNVVISAGHRKTRQPDCRKSGKPHPGDSEYEPAERCLERGIGQGAHHRTAGPCAGDGADEKGCKAGPGNLVAQQDGTADIGAQLHHAMNGDDGRDGNEVSHQSEQNDTAADAGGDSQCRGKKTCGDENGGRPEIKSRRRQN